MIAVRDIFKREDSNEKTEAASSRCSKYAVQLTGKEEDCRTNLWKECYFQQRQRGNNQQATGTGINMLCIFPCFFAKKARKTNKKVNS